MIVTGINLDTGKRLPTKLMTEEQWAKFKAEQAKLRRAYKQRTGKYPPEVYGVRR